MYVLLYFLVNIDVQDTFMLKHIHTRARALTCPIIYECVIYKHPSGALFGFRMLLYHPSRCYFHWRNIFALLKWFNAICRADKFNKLMWCHWTTRNEYCLCVGVRTERERERIIALQFIRTLKLFFKLVLLSAIPKCIAYYIDGNCHFICA